MTNETNSPASPDLHDFTTHRTSWRKAIEHLATQDDSGYWKHEVAAYDKAMAAFDADRAQRSGVSADPLPDLDVDLPDRVIDQLMHDAGVSLMEPWSEQEMYDFANTVKREVLARVPLKMLAASPQHQVKKGEPS